MKRYYPGDDGVMRELPRNTEGIHGWVMYKDALAEKAELVAALRDLLGEAVILSRDYLKAFQTEPGDYCIQGWDKARWERALMAKEKAQALLRRIEEDEA